MKTVYLYDTNNKLFGTTNLQDEDVPENGAPHILLHLPEGKTQEGETVARLFARDFGFMYREVPRVTRTSIITRPKV